MEMETLSHWGGGKELLLGSTQSDMEQGTGSHPTTPEMQINSTMRARGFQQENIDVHMDKTLLHSLAMQPQLIPLPPKRF